jgi:hypothetical protein
MLRDDENPKIRYQADGHELPASLFLALAHRVWPRQYNGDLANEALRRTLNITAWDADNLVGCVRILSDGYFFGTIPEIR